MSKKINTTLTKLFYEPVFLAFVYIIVAFQVHFGALLNSFGLGIFSMLSLLLNLFWVVFFAYYWEKFTSSETWAGLYLIWLVSVLFFIWALYQKTLIDLAFYSDMLILALAGVVFFRSIDDKAWIPFALALNTGYLFYASLQEQKWFYVLILWLIISGFWLDRLVGKNVASAGKLAIRFAGGLIFFILGYYVMKLVKILVISG